MGLTQILAISVYSNKVPREVSPEANVDTSALKTVGQGPGSTGAGPCVWCRGQHTPQHRISKHKSCLSQLPRDVWSSSNLLKQLSLSSQSAKWRSQWDPFCWVVAKCLTKGLTYNGCLRFFLILSPNEGQSESV